MKTEELKEIRYSAKACSLAHVWKALCKYLETYPYIIDKIIWLFEIEQAWVSVIPGSPEDAEDPDIRFAFQFLIPDLWANEQEGLSEQKEKFTRAYEKRKRWLKKHIKSSFATANKSGAVDAHGLDGKLGIYMAEYWERLMPAALTYVCGNKIKFEEGDSPDDVADWFCKKYDILAANYVFPGLPDVHEIYFLIPPRLTTGLVEDIRDLRKTFPELKVVNLGFYVAEDMPSDFRSKCQRMGFTVRHLSEEEDDEHLKGIDGISTQPTSKHSY